jgi:hypothetical protein
MRLGGVVDRVSSGLRVTSSQAEALSANSVSADPCPNCGRGPVGRYCAACGQKQLTAHDLTARAFLHDTFHELTSLDGRLWHTVVTLLAHPGKLARDYFDGRGGRYMKPLNLFVLLNLVFFLVQPHTGLMQYHLRGYLQTKPARIDEVDAKRIDRATEAEAKRESSGLRREPLSVESREQFEARFEDGLQDLKKSMLIIGIPIFALALGLAYVGQRRSAGEHLVFSSHFWAFFLVVMTVITPVFRVFVRGTLALGAPAALGRFMSTEAGLMLVLYLTLGTYLFFALRRMYGSSPLGAALRATALYGVLAAFLYAFALILFDATLWTL